MKGWVAVRSPSGPTFDLKFFPFDYACGFAKICCKNTQGGMESGRKDNIHGISL